MAAPATHIILANKIYKNHFSDKDFAKFIVGTSFPDIRYLGVVDRDATHFKNLKLDDIKSEDSFTAGLQLHSLVDEVREKYMIEKGLYELFPQSQFLTQGVKIFEDRVLYNKIKNWAEILSSFENVYEEETKFSISNSHIERWHSLIVKILSHEPDNDDIEIFASEIDKTGALATGIKEVVNNPTDKQKATEIVLKFYDDFEGLI